MLQQREGKGKEPMLARSDGPIPLVYWDALANKIPIGWALSHSSRRLLLIFNPIVFRAGN